MTQPLEPRGRWWTRNPLRVRLVAAMLALVAFALVVIGTASTFALHSYMIDQIDSRLTGTAQSINQLLLDPRVKGVVPPLDYAYGLATSDGGWDPRFDERRFVPADLPAVSTTPAALDDHLDQPYTATGSDGQYRWRILITNVGNQKLVLSQNLSTVDSAIGRLILVE